MGILLLLIFLPPLLSIALLYIFSLVSHAEMESENYKIPTSVFSGGGMPAGSTNYQTDSTLGQPSPLMQGDQNPYSDNYDNYPGFWYTVKGTDVCEFDFDGDKDVDGSDLAEFIADPDLLDLSVFAVEFGRTDCPPS